MGRKGLLAEDWAGMDGFTNVESNLFGGAVGDVKDAAGLLEHHVAIKHGMQEAVGHATGEITVEEQGLGRGECQLPKEAFARPVDRRGPQLSI